ncbi:MAG: S8 family serine peptidase, partial [Desulfobacterales bacterium]
MWSKQFNKVERCPAAGLWRRSCWIIAVLCLVAAASAPAAADADLPKEDPLYPALVPGELLVKFRPGVRNEASAEYQEWFNISTQRTFAINGYQHVRLPEGVDVEEALELYLEDPDVEHAEPNYIVRAAIAPPDDTHFNRLWSLHNTGQNVNGTSGTNDADIDMLEAWDVTTGSSDVVVAVIDSGVDVNHPDLAANIWTNPGEIAGNGDDDDGNGYVDDVNGWDFYIDDNDPRDANGHGTHVAGTIAAVGDNTAGIAGVSWSAKIMVLRFLDAWGSGSTANAIAAIEYANDMGADVINNSWGGGLPSQALRDAIAVSDAVVVCAAGNTANNNDSSPFYPASYSSANIIAVAASDQNDTLAYFSNYGANSVDVAAPGTNIYSAAPGRETVWEDDFEDNDIGDWTTGGSSDDWDATNEEAYAGAYSLTDSPNANYQDSTYTWAYSPLIDLSNRTAARLEFKIYGNAEAGYDALWVEASTNTVTWNPVNLQISGNPTLGIGVTGLFASWTTVIADLEAYDDSSSVYVRFRLTSDITINADGYYLDDVKVTAASTSYSGNEYIFKDGTSMATPHVAGLAALLKAHNPALNNIQIKAAIEDSVDFKAALNNRVATDGRINAAAALAAPQISNVQVSAITETTAVITWTTDIAGDSQVQYGPASRSWGSYPNTVTETAMVTSHSVTLSGLSQQTNYYFMVGSTDIYGNGPGNKAGDMNPAAEDTFTTRDPDPPSMVEFPVINFAADTITITYDEQNMQNADDEDNYNFSPSMNFRTVNPTDDDIADLGNAVFRLSMASIPAYQIFTLTVSNITDLAGNPVTPASIKLNDNDMDNMADDWEIQYGLNPASNDGADDTDGDGWTNFEEYKASTNPRSAASAPLIIQDTIPNHNAGITDTQRVPDNSDFAVLVESAHGIDTTDNTSVRFIIDDGVNPDYIRNLGSATVRVEKLTADPDDQVTRMWVVYERSQEGGPLRNFPYDSDVNIKVDCTDVQANDMVQASVDFNVETLDEHEDAQNAASIP